MGEHQDIATQELLAVLRRLVREAERGRYRDYLGHPLVNNLDYQDARALLDAMSPPDAA